MPIELSHVTHTYMAGTAFEQVALRDVSFSIPDGSFTALAGHTGSGKSTLAQMLAGLIHPSEGRVLVDGTDLSAHGRAGRAAARDARQRVGLVFQYPEHQLFEETVEADIAFGPGNMGLGEEEISTRVRESMRQMGLDYDALASMDPFRLSGGQKRRVAIAGVLAMRPRYLVLDEPTAGLDPAAREQLLREIERLHREQRTTIVLVSHSMDDIARLADRVIILAHGECVLEAAPGEAFWQRELLEGAGLRQPRITALLGKIRERGIPVLGRAIMPDAGIEEILDALAIMQGRDVHTCSRESH